MSATFKIESCCRVQIDHEEGNDLFLRFLRWTLDEEIIGFRGGSAGTTGVVKYYPVRYREQIARSKPNSAGHASPPGRWRSPGSRSIPLALLQAVSLAPPCCGGESLSATARPRYPCSRNRR